MANKHDPYFQQAQRGHVKLRAHAFLNTSPRTLYFSDHSVELRNCSTHDGFVTGVYGHSADDAQHLADRRAHALKSQLISVNLHFPVRGGMPDKVRIDRDEAIETGFLHIDRLTSDFREEIRNHTLDLLRRYVGEAAYIEHQESKLHQIFLAHPCVARLLMQSESWIDIVIYPAFLAYDPPKDHERPIFVATVRAERAAQAQAQAVHLEDQIQAYGGHAA